MAYIPSKTAEIQSTNPPQEHGDVDCAICLESIESTDRIILECNHTFHLLCIDMLKNLHHQQRCPLCREDIKIRQLPPLYFTQMSLEHYYNLMSIRNRKKMSDLCYEFTLFRLLQMLKEE